MARTNGSEHLRYRYGICLNDQCSKCKSKEVQTILARKDFVCEECGKALRECPPPVSFWGKYGKAIIAVGVVVVIAAIVAIVMSLGGGEEKPAVNPPARDTVKVEEDTLTKTTPTVEQEKTEAEPQKDEEKTAKGKESDDGTSKPTTPAGPKVSFGKYQGPASGIGGVITVTRAYSLDLRTGTGETIELQAGDEIQNTRFKDGDLRGGVLVRGSERKSFNR